MKIVSRSIFIVLGLVVVVLGFVYFSPDFNMYIVRSESMTPTINMGDMIVTGPVSGQVDKETIITYERNDELITHRVHSIEGSKITTKGDAVEEPDPWSITVSDIKGAYLLKIPYVGYVTSFIQTKTGWFLAIIVPSALLVLWLAKDIVKEALSTA